MVKPSAAALDKAKARPYNDALAPWRDPRIRPEPLKCPSGLTYERNC